MAVVFASPHSGTDYPAGFPRRLAPRRSTACGAPRIAGSTSSSPRPRRWARRCWLPSSRAPSSIRTARPSSSIPQMFEDALPAEANTASPRVAAGLGVIPRVVATGEEIYGRKLALRRGRRSGSSAIGAPITRRSPRRSGATRRRFGSCVLIDCHSMPSVGGPPERETGWDRVDFVLGDCRATSCAPAADRAGGDHAAPPGLYRGAQQPLFRRLCHPALRPAGRGRPCPADRDQPRPLSRRGEPRARSRLPAPGRAI